MVPSTYVSMRGRTKDRNRNLMFCVILFIPSSYFQTKLDSFLEKDHYKALVLMRQLHYIEMNFCKTYANDAFYLNKEVVQDIESILLDMV